MNELFKNLLLALCIGVGATLIMDVWLVLLRRLGVPTLSFAFVGRWVGHLFRGKIRHESIASAEPIPQELRLGWFMHYATGIAFAALLLGIEGISWARQPTVLPALVFGIATVAVPLLLIQPAMGAGIASIRTKTPAKNSFKSLVNHSVFGLGLYLAAALLTAVA